MDGVTISQEVSWRTAAVVPNLVIENVDGLRRGNSQGFVCKVVVVSSFLMDAGACLQVWKPIEHHHDLVRVVLVVRPGHPTLVAVPIQD